MSPHELQKALEHHSTITCDEGQAIKNNTNIILFTRRDQVAPWHGIARKKCDFASCHSHHEL